TLFRSLRLVLPSCRRLVPARRSRALRGGDAQGAGAGAAGGDDGRGRQSGVRGRMSIDEQVVEWRRHLHRNPEPSFHEHDTAAFIASTLASFGLEVSRPTETGVVARLGNGGGRVVALRADIDALPIAEQSGVPVARERPGFMHACGHDGHTAMLLGAAKVLSESPPDGEVRFLFQPAEELAPGGARDMVAAGVMEGVDLVYGCHLWAPVPYGQVVAQPG